MRLGLGEVEARRPVARPPSAADGGVDVGRVPPGQDDLGARLDVVAGDLQADGPRPADDDDRSAVRHLDYLPSRARRSSKRAQLSHHR